MALIILPLGIAYLAWAGFAIFYQVLFLAWVLFSTIANGLGWLLRLMHAPV